MLRIKVGSNTSVQDFVVEVTDTPVSVIEKAKAGGIGFSTNGVMSLNGRVLNIDEYGKTLEQLGVRDGSEGNFLVSAVKADSAC